MIQLSLLKFIYGLLYNLPRSIMDLLAALISVITLGWYNPSFHYYKLWAHSCWADRISKKYSGMLKYLEKHKD